jgi:HAE1 family hydrophobic/amphiphilic exporter-1
MMTTMAALFGAVPIALGRGAGGETRQPLGLAVVGGLLFSQLLQERPSCDTPCD